MSLELRRAFGRNIKMRIELGHKIGEADRIIVEHRDIARGLIGHMHFVPVVSKPNEGTAHRNHIVIWVWREYDDALGENAVSRMRSIAGPLGMGRLAARPTGDCRLK